MLVGNGVITGLTGFVVVESGFETVGFRTGVVVVGVVGFAVGTVVIGVVMSLWVLEISPFTFEPETETEQIKSTLKSNGINFQVKSEKLTQFKHQITT